MKSVSFFSSVVGLMMMTIVGTSCSTSQYLKTVDYIDIPKFMGTWYVWAGKFTFLEKDVYNSVEIYTWNAEKNRIDIDFSFNKGSLTGPLKKIPQKATIYNSKSNAHWKVSPFWPLKFDYLVIAHDPAYQWTVIGVPGGDKLWIMGRKPKYTRDEVAAIIAQVKALPYPVEDIVYVEHN